MIYIINIIVQPYLLCDDLLKCILDISRNNIFQLFMGEVYYKILETDILSQSYYWHLLSDHWNSKCVYIYFNLKNVFNYIFIIFRFVFIGMQIIYC